jgi:alpha-1,2-mannosyltransferase
VSDSNPSQAMSLPFTRLALPRDAAFAFFAISLALSFALYVVVIKAYSNESIFGAMYRAAFWLEMEDSWSPMLEALTYVSKGNYSGLYDHIFFTQKTKFQYAVSSLFFLETLTYLIKPTYPNLNLFNFGLMPLIGLALAWLTRELGFWRDWRPGLAWAAACGFWTLTNFPVIGALNLGQIQLWIDLLFIVACVLWIRDERLAAGFLIGLIALMKPQMAALLVWAVLRRHWSFVQGFLLAAVPITLFCLYRYGFWNNLEYLGVLKYVAQHGESFFANQSINGILNRYFGNGPNIHFSDNDFAAYDIRVHIGTMVSSLVIIAIALFVRPGPREDRHGLDFMLAALAFTIASPVVWDHHYGVTPAMFLVALAVMRDLHARGQPMALYAALFLFASVLVNANLNAYFNTWRHTPTGTLMQAYKFYGGMALFVLLLLLRPRAAPARA